MEMCRACLTTGQGMIRMDEDFVNNYNLLTSLNIVLSADLPLYTCNVCYDAVKFCVEFKEKCISSDLTLKEILFPDKHERKPNGTTGIKKEVKLEYNDDPIEFEDIYNDTFEEYKGGDYFIESVREDSIEEYDGEYLFNDDDTNWVPKKRVKGEKKKLKKKLLPSVLVVKKSKTDDSRLHCGVCTKIFENSEDLIKHYEHHKQDKACGLCLERFLDFTHLLAHRLVHLPDKQKSCHICSRKFVSANSMEFHYIKDHKLNGENGQLLCKICLRPYPSPVRLRKHMAYKHCDIKYSCDECGKGCRTKSALKCHMLSHNEDKTFECDLCEFSCRFPGGVREHKIRKHTEGKVHCKTCGRAFPSQERLDKHICKHLLKVICPVCGVYVRSSVLPRHMETHNDVYRYECDRCPAKYKSISSYKAHMDKHDGNRTHHCPFCPMSFYSRPVLIKHRRVHTGEKPYVCEICSRGFTGNHNLKVHMKVHGINLIVKRNVDPHVKSL